MATRFEDVPLHEIQVGSRLRALRRDRVDVLKQTISLVGLKQPIVLGENVWGLHLAAGLHRFTAVEELGWEAVPAKIETLSDDQARAELELRLIEVIENIDREELSALDRAEHLAALQDVQQQLNPRRRRGGDRRSEDAKLQSLQFDLSDDLADRVGLSPRAVALAISIARGIAPEVKARVAETWLADHQAQLRLLAEQKPARRQIEIVELIFGAKPKAASVIEAVALLDGRPITVADAPLKRLSGSFARLSKRDQFGFFEAHAELIEEWLTDRRGGQ